MPQSANMQNLSGLRYKQLKLGSPAIWLAASRRAKLVSDSIKKSRHVALVLIPFMKLLHKEASEKTFVEPSVQNVQDVLAAMILEQPLREKAFAFYERLLSLRELFRRSQHRLRVGSQKSR